MADNTIPDDEIICECNDVTAGEIRQAIADGCTDLDCIGGKCDAGTACEQCKSLDDDTHGKRDYHILEDFLR